MENPRIVLLVIRKCKRFCKLATFDFNVVLFGDVGGGGRGAGEGGGGQ